MDTMVGVVQRERPVAVGILAASLAFRLFALLIPLTYVVVAGLGFAADSAAADAAPRADHLRDLVVTSVAAATNSSHRARSSRAWPPASIVSSCSRRRRIRDRWPAIARLRPRTGPATPRTRRRPGGR